MPADIQSPALRLSGYGVCFGRRVILASVDLTLPEAGVDVLMGPVKAGKSTLMRSLAGINQATALFRNWGQAELWGRPIDDSWRPALVQQHATALNASVRDAVIFGCRRQQLEHSGTAWTDIAQQALASNGLGHLTDKLADPVLSLPLEWQRAVNILSHALVRPPLLMVDEPTYGLTDPASAWLTDWLIELGKSTRLVVALHHQGQARKLADRVILLGGGRVLAHEPSPRFFTHPVNPWVEQLVRTGSVSVASPDARLEDLAPEVEPPPPLSAAALAALAEFETAVAEPARGDRTELAPPRESQSAAARAPADEPPAQRFQPKETAVSAPSEPPVDVVQKPTRARLPPTSNQGVGNAAMVGRAIMSEYRAPRGFHWIVPGQLAGCAEPGVSAPIDYDLDLLCGVGITRLITLTEKDLDQDALERSGIENLHLPIFDREPPSIRQAYMLVRRMQAFLDEGHVVAVHCKAGIGRTGTLLAAWLVREGGVSASNAIARLRNINPAYVQSVAQEEFLQEFEQDILQRM